MSCNCKHMEKEIDAYRKQIIEFGNYFVKRMTVDSEHNDRRRKDYNQAIFHYNDDGSTYQVFYETDLEMVMECFCNALDDWRKSFCDVKSCRRY